MIWTETSIAQLKKLFLEGQSFSQIARQLGGGCTRNAALGKAARLGMTRDNAAKPGWPSGSTAKTKRPAQTAVKAAPRLVVAGPSASFERGPLSEAKPPQTHLVEQADAAPVQAGLKTLAERERNECAWPVGAPDPVRGQLFCGRPTSFRKSYCCDHNPNQAASLKSIRLKDDAVRRSRPERSEYEVDLMERFA